MTHWNIDNGLAELQMGFAFRCLLRRSQQCQYRAVAPSAALHPGYWRNHLEMDADASSGMVIIRRNP